MNHLTAGIFAIIRWGKHFSPARTARLLRAAPELLIMVKGMMLDLQVVAKKVPTHAGPGQIRRLFPTK